MYDPEICAGEDLINMSPEELASDARKSQNAQIRKEALKESERGQHLKKVQALPSPCSSMFNVLPAGE